MIAVWKISLRPYRSEILPHSGVDAVWVSRYAVTTHDKWFRPPSSLVIRGSAVPTMDWSRAARNIPAISPDITTRICRWLR